MSLQPHSHDDDRDDGDTASQRSISLDSVDSRGGGFNSIPISPTLQPIAPSKHESHPSLDTDLSSEPDTFSLSTNEIEARESPNTSAAPSVYDRDDRHSVSGRLSPHKPAPWAPSSAVSNVLSPSVYGESEPSPISPKISSASSPYMNPSSPLVHSSSSPHRPLSSANSDAIPSPFIPRELPSIYDDSRVSSLNTYPPMPSKADRESIKSFASGSSYARKTRPESLLLEPPDGPIVQGIALVDFNHLVCFRFLALELA